MSKIGVQSETLDTSLYNAAELLEWSHVLLRASFTSDEAYGPHGDRGLRTATELGLRSIELSQQE
jgi:hypothetical protein